MNKLKAFIGIGLISIAIGIGLIAIPILATIGTIILVAIIIYAIWVDDNKHKASTKEEE